MREGSSSRTAEYMALFRALESSLPESPGSQVLFTYVHRDVLTKPGAFIGTEKLFASLEKFGEKWTFGIDPTGLSRFLVDRGLSLEADLGASEYRERYFGKAAREMRGYEFYRIAIARVGS